MNTEKCFADLTAVKTELQSFLSHSISLASAQAEVAKLKPLFTAMLSDCTVGLASINSSPDILLVALNTDLVKCVGDVASLAPAVTKLVLDSNKKDLPAIIGDLTVVVQDVGSCLEDCFKEQ